MSGRQSALPETETAEPRPSGGRELFRITVGVALFVLVGPLILGAVLFVGVIATTVVADAIDALHLGRGFDPLRSMVVATGLMLVVLRFGWLMVYGALLLPTAASGAVIGLRHLALGPGGRRFAIATGLAVGLVADVAVVGYGWRMAGGLRIGIFAGWVVIGGLIATFACWRLAGMAPTSASAL